MRGKSASEMLSALRGHLMLLGAAVLWGCNAPMIKDLQGLGVPALVVADMRAVGAAVAFWVMSLFVGGGERVSVSMLGRLCVAGILCIVLNQVLFTVGVNYTSPIDATVISTMLPIVTMIFAAIILKESITGMKVVGIAVGAAGALTLVFGGGGSSVGGGLVGDALCFTAQVSCALYMVIFSNTIHRYSVVTLMKWLFLFSAIIVTMVTWPSVVAVDYASLPLKAWGEMLFIVFGGGGSSVGGGLVGDALCFTAQVSCALYMVIFSNTIHRYSVVTLMKWLFLFSAIIVTMVTWPSVVAVDYASLPLKAWGEMLFIVFGGTFVSYIFFTGGQKLLRPTVVSMYNYVQPIVATVLSVAMGVGSFGVGKVISMAMVFAGVYIVTHAKNSTAKG